MTLKNRLKSAYNGIKTAISGTYTGASTKRSLRSWTPISQSPNKDIQYDIYTLRDRSRDLYKNNSIGRGAVKNLTNSVIGSGLRLQSRIDRKFLNLTDEEADNWEYNTHREFELWASDQRCDIRQNSNFYDLQELIFLNYLVAGEVFVLLPVKQDVNQPYNLRINPIEADLIETPADLLSNEYLFNGIETDKSGATIAYYILDYHPNDVFYGNKVSTNFKRVVKYGKSGRQNVLHIFRPERPGQSRGLPFLSPVIDIIKQITKYSDAFLQKQIVNSLYTVFIRTDAGLLPDTDIPDSDKVLSATESQYAYELGAGAVIGLAPGEEIQTATPGSGDPTFDPFFLSCLKQIAIGLNIPYEVIAKHFQSSYTAARAALLDFFQTVKSDRLWFSNHFNKPIYREFVTEGILNGRIVANGFFDDPAIQQAWLGSVWNGSTMGQIDPVKETNAYNMQVSSGYITRQDAASMLNGSDWESNMGQIKMENSVLNESNKILLDGMDTVGNSELF
jgi:lambda family phage portal protein